MFLIYTELWTGYSLCYVLIGQCDGHAYCSMHRSVNAVRMLIGRCADQVGRSVVLIDSPVMKTGPRIRFTGPLLKSVSAFWFSSLPGKAHPNTPRLDSNPTLIAKPKSSFLFFSYIRLSWYSAFQNIRHT